jgi:hypothetical protein
MIDFIASGTFGAWVFRQVAASFLIAAIPVGLWWTFRRPHWRVAVICLVLIWPIALTIMSILLSILLA